MVGTPQTLAPSKAPHYTTKTPTQAPVPTSQPSSPTKAPVLQPTKAPMPQPTKAPMPQPSSSPTPNRMDPACNYMTFGGEHSIVFRDVDSRCSKIPGEDLYARFSCNDS